jgi:hypothetical protein
METPGIAAIIKGLSVSICGKFGQIDRQWVDEPRKSAIDLYGEWWEVDANGNYIRYRAIAGKVQREIRLGFAADAVPSIAAWITSAGRIHLLQHIRIVGWENTYYVDTDGIITNQSGFDRLCQSNLIDIGVLGTMQLKHRSSRVDIRGIKHYAYEGGEIASGIPRLARENSDGTREGHYIPSPSECVRAGCRPERTRTIGEFSRVDEYKHGNVDIFGCVHPIELKEF